MQVIIYKNNDNGVSVIYPIQQYVEQYGIHAIALKDVPPNTPFKIVDITDLPLDGTVNEMGIPNIDRTFRSQWEVDEADLTDGVGAESNEFSEVTDEPN